MYPSWSPDGSQIAFSGSGSGFDIFVKVVGEDRAPPIDLRAASDRHASWSPDGRRIAFVRVRTDEPETLYLVSPHGGTPRKVLDGVSDAAWDPDSASLVVGLAEEAISGEPSVRRAIYRYTLATQRLERLTAPEGVAVDFGAQVSRESGAVAFIRCSNPGRANCDVFVLESGPHSRGVSRASMCSSRA